MDRLFTVKLAEEPYQSLQTAAAEAGQSLEEWMKTRLRAYAPRVAMSEKVRDDAMLRLMRHAGAVDVGHATAAENEGIDTDLAREFGGSHETDI